jgi:hypothetical protein
MIQNESGEQVNNQNKTDKIPQILSADPSNFEPGSYLFEYFVEYVGDDWYWFVVKVFLTKKPQTEQKTEKHEATDQKLMILVYRQKTHTSNSWQEYRRMVIPLFDDSSKRRQAPSYIKTVKIAIKDLYYLPNFNLILYYEEEVEYSNESEANSTTNNDAEKRNTYVSYIDLKKMSRNYRENRAEVTLDFESGLSSTKKNRITDLRNKPVIRMTPQRDYLIIRGDSTYFTLIKTQDLGNHSLESLLSAGGSFEFRADADMIITDFTILKVDTTPDSAAYQTATDSNPPQEQPTCDLFVSYVQCDIKTAVRYIGRHE